MSDPDFSQRLVLGALLQAHPRMLGVEDLRAELDDVAGVDEAISRLADDGLASRLGDRVGASRAAVRSQALRI